MLKVQKLCPQLLIENRKLCTSLIYRENFNKKLEVFWVQGFISFRVLKWCLVLYQTDFRCKAKTRKIYSWNAALLHKTCSDPGKLPFVCRVPQDRILTEKILGNVSQSWSNFILVHSHNLAHVRSIFIPENKCLLNMGFKIEMFKNTLTIFKATPFRLYVY